MNDEPQAGCLGYVLLIAAGLWIIAATLFIHIVAWTTGQYLLYEDTPLTGYQRLDFTRSDVCWMLLARVAGMPVGYASLVRDEEQRHAFYRFFAELEDLYEILWPAVADRAEQAVRNGQSFQSAQKRTAESRRSCRAKDTALDLRTSRESRSNCRSRFVPMP